MFMISIDDNNSQIYTARKKVIDRAKRKYGREFVPYRLNFCGEDAESNSDDIATFKRLFQIDDSNLKVHLWNSIIIHPDRFDTIDKNAFSSDEYDFIQNRFEAYKRSEKLNNNVFPNKNCEINASRIILRAPSELNQELYRKHLKEDGDFGMYTGLRLNKENLDMFSLFRSPYTFSIIEKETGDMAGFVGLYDYDEIRRMAQIEWYMFKPYRNKGYMKEAISALTQSLFNKKLFEIRETVKEDVYKKHYAKIDLIRAVVRVSNEASQRTALACGFKEQYTDRRHAIINETQFEDCIVYDLEPN